eukprot:7126537-Prymnesium_polylepis.2
MASAQQCSRPPVLFSQPTPPQRPHAAGQHAGIARPADRRLPGAQAIFWRKSSAVDVIEGRADKSWAGPAGRGVE